MKNKAELITAISWLVYFPEASSFHNTIPKHIDVFVTSHKLKKNLRCVNRALALATKHEQPFPLPHYHGIPSVNSATQTNDVKLLLSDNSYTK